MKDLFIYTIMLWLCIGINSIAYSQDAKIPKNKEVTVKSEIEDGTKKTTVQVKLDGEEKNYSWEGDDIPLEIKQELDDLEINIDLSHDPEDGKNVRKGYELRESIERDAEKEKQIRVIIKDGNSKTIEWDGEGEIPADIKKELEERGDAHEGAVKKHKVIIKSDDGGENVFEWDGEEMPEQVRKSIGDSEVEHYIDTQIRRGSANKAFLGIAMAQSIEEKTENGVTESNKSLSIDHVIPGSGADKSGLLKDNQLLKMNGIDLTGADHVIELLAPFKPGDEITLTIKRSGELKDVKVVLTEPLEKHEMHQEMIIKKEMIKEKVIQDAPATQQIIKQSGSLELEELQIHPNPSHGKLSIYFKSRPINTKVSVSDMSGKLLYEKKVDDFDGVFREEINLETMPKGALIVKIEQGGKMTTKKIMHQ